MRKLLAEAGFSIIDFDGTGFFHRVIANASYFLRWSKPVHSIFARLQNLDAKLFESTNLFCVAEKRQTHKVYNDHDGSSTEQQRDLHKKQTAALEDS